MIYLDDGEFAQFTPNPVVVTDDSGDVVNTTIETIAWDSEDTGKSGYDHYMLKEINEQPTALRQCLRGRLDELFGGVDLGSLEALDWNPPVRFVACGTSYHATAFAARL